MKVTPEAKDKATNTLAEEFARFVLVQMREQNLTLGTLAKESDSSTPTIIRGRSGLPVQMETIAGVSLACGYVPHLTFEQCAKGSMTSREELG